MEREGEMGERKGLTAWAVYIVERGRGGGGRRRTWAISDQRVGLGLKQSSHCTPGRLPTGCPPPIWLRAKVRCPLTGTRRNGGQGDARSCVSSPAPSIGLAPATLRFSVFLPPTSHCDPALPTPSLIANPCRPTLRLSGRTLRMGRPRRHAQTKTLPSTRRSLWARIWGTALRSSDRRPA